MNTPVIRLKDLCSLITKGTTPTSIGFDFSDDGIGFLRVQNVIGGSVNFQYGTLFIEENVHQELRRSQILPGDILLSIAGTIGRTGVVPAHAPALNCNQALAIIRPDVKVFRPFLRHWLESANAQLQMRGATVTGTIQNLSLAQVGGLLVPLPPLPEQRRIAAILDQADALRVKRRAALAQLDNLTQSIFIEMFGDPITNDMSWPSGAVSDFVAGFESGKSIVADDEDESDSPYRVLKISAVTSLEYKPKYSKAIPSDYTPPLSHIVRKGDLLFSRANTTELIGATAFVNETPDNLLLPDKLWRFIWFDKPRATPLYVRHLFQQAKFRHEIGIRASGSSGSMQNISQPKVLSIQVGHPPLKLQQTFSKRVEAIEAIKDSHSAALTQLNTLFASLQHRAFRGEL